VSAPDAAVLACDLPFMTADVVAGLRESLAAAEEDASAALLVDDDGRDQPLCSVWRSARLRAALARLGDPAGAPVRSLVDVAGVVVRTARKFTGVDAGAVPPPWFDCDTPEDLVRARRWATRLSED
jgi:molybdopterin-guanine dinucleotide biosynthesis protein A